MRGLREHVWSREAERQLAVHGADRPGHSAEGRGPRAAATCSASHSRRRNGQNLTPGSQDQPQVQ